MKSFTIFLLDGKKVTIQADNYTSLLFDIDRFIDILKENVCYYAGYDDNSIIEQAVEQGINLIGDKD